MDLTTIMHKKGAVDAISLIIDSRNRDIIVKKPDKKDKEDKNTDGGKSAKSSDQSSKSSNNNQSKESPLHMPKNIKEVDADEERKKQDEEEGKTPEEIATMEKEKNDAADFSAEEIAKDISQIKSDTEYKKVEAERKRLRASQSAARSFASQNKISDFGEFENDLKHAINKQVNISSKPEDDYRKYNGTYHNSDFLMPGQGYPEKRSIPVVNVYMDMSTSWHYSDTEKGREAIKSLDVLQRRKKLKYKLYWFANHVVDDPEDRAGMGRYTHAFPEILEHVKNTHANNVIIFTDHDFDSQSGDMDKLPYLKLPGCVWWLWKDGSRATDAFKHLQARKPENTFQYSFNT